MIAPNLKMEVNSFGQSRSLTSSERRRWVGVRLSLSSLLSTKTHRLFFSKRTSTWPQLFLYCPFLLSLPNFPKQQRRPATPRFLTNWRAATLANSLWSLPFQAHRLTQRLQPLLIHTVPLSNLVKDVPSSEQAQSLASKLVSFARCPPPEKKTATLSIALPQPFLFLTLLILFHTTDNHRLETFRSFLLWTLWFFFSLQ